MPLCLWPPGETGSEADALVARPFGTLMSDLAVDFSQSLNTVIDDVLQRCLSRADGTAIGGGAVGKWNIAKRRQGLLATAVATHGPRRTVTATCDARGCGEMLDLEFDLTTFKRDWRSDEVPFEEGRLRLPRPADLSILGVEAPERLARILFEGKTPRYPGWEAEAEKVLSAADPLGDLELRGECFNCGAPISVTLELETFLLNELANVASRLMDEVHVLAFAYHWSESDIMALPKGRRQHYLARIQEVWAA